jgi:hypothetical protein
MTPIPPSESSSSPTEPESGGIDGQKVFVKVAKGCGCTTASVLLAIGVGLAGGGVPESWGSALVGVLFLLLIVGSSGLTGWHKQ